MSQHGNCSLKRVRRQQDGLASGFLPPGIELGLVGSDLAAGPLFPAVLDMSLVVTMTAECAESSLCADRHHSVVLSTDCGARLHATHSAHDWSPPSPVGGSFFRHSQ